MAAAPLQTSSIAIMLLCLALAACGEGGGSAEGGADATAASQAEIPLGTPAQAARRPKPAVPRGPASGNLIVRDVVQGTGPVGEAGDVLLVRYVAGIHESGEEIEEAGYSQSLGFMLGSGSWSVGFESGMRGMRVGGRRVLIFPTTPATLPPGSELGDTLVYVVDLLGISAPGG